MIIKLVILLCIFFIILHTLRFNEKFTLDIPNPILNNTNFGIHTVVDPEEYNLKYYGPKCLNTCVVEHVQKINWDETLKSGSNYAKEKILQYNRDNPKSGYCHLANVPINQESTIKNCLTNDCKCGTDNYSDCRIKGKNFCSEDKLNYLSGGAILNKTKCGGANNCINKYWANIEKIKSIYDTKIDELNDEGGD